MKKIVVFDSGFGGELFADQLEKELPVAEVIRVIDWRHASEFQSNSRKARKLAEEALRPYLNRVDLIIFANYLLSMGSLKYFKRKYSKQDFIGLAPAIPDDSLKRDTLVLTTKAVTLTKNYYDYIFHLKRKVKTLTMTLDDWPLKIDDGILNSPEISDALKPTLLRDDFKPKEVILLCSQFNDIKSELRNILGHNIKIYDSFNATIREVCRLLKIRGGLKKLKV